MLCRGVSDVTGFARVHRKPAGGASDSARGGARANRPGTDDLGPGTRWRRVCSCVRALGFGARWPLGRRVGVTAVVWFTRDLRVHDHPALHAAATEHEQVVPVFVLDETILRSDYARPNRARFLLDCLRDLDASLRRAGAGLVV